MSSLRKISEQTAWQLINKAVSSLSTIFILGLVGRKFGTEGTGIYTQALTYIAMFFLLSDFGFNAHFLPFLKSENSESVWRKLFGARFIWSFGLFLLAILILPLLPFSNQEFASAVILGALGILGNSIFLTCGALFQSRLSMEFSSLASSLGIIIMTALIYLLIKSDFPIQSLLAAQGFGWLITGTTSLLLVRRYLKNIQPMFDFSFLKSAFADTWPISLTLVLNLVYFRFDSFVLASIKSFSEVGIYNLAYSIFQSVLVLPAFIMNGLYPMMIDQIKISGDSFKRYFKKASISLFLMSLLGVGLAYILSPFIVKIWGENFSGSVDSLRILSLGFPIYFLTALFMWTLVTLKKYKAMALIYGVGLIFNILGNLIFIPHYSYLASSWLTVASELLILILQVFILRQWIW